MKFKKDKNSEDGTRRIRLADRWTDTVRVDADPDGKTIWVITERAEGNGDGRTGPLVMLSRAKALKLAWAIIDELNPSII